MSSDGSANKVNEVSAPVEDSDEEYPRVDRPSSSPSRPFESDSDSDSADNEDDDDDDSDEEEEEEDVAGSSGSSDASDSAATDEDSEEDAADTFSSKLDTVNFILMLHMADFTKVSYMVNMLLVAMDAEQTQSISSLVTKYGENRHPDGEAYITRRRDGAADDDDKESRVTNDTLSLTGAADDDESTTDEDESSGHDDDEKIGPCESSEVNIVNKKHVLIILIADSSYYILPVDPAPYIRDQILHLNSAFDITIDIIAVSPYNAATQQLWDKAKMSTKIEQAMTLSFWHRAYCKSTKRMIVDLPSLLVMLITRFPYATIHMMEGNKQRGTEHFSYSNYVNNAYNLPPGIVPTRRTGNMTEHEENEFATMTVPV